MLGTLQRLLLDALLSADPSARLRQLLANKSELSDQERAWLKPTMWIGPSLMAAPLLAELILVLKDTGAADMAHTVTAAKQVGIVLFGPYVLAVELASMLLLAGLVGAYHLARK